jgi:hypothetical protein
MPFSHNNPELREDGSPQQLFPVPPIAGNLITAVDRCWVCDEVFPKYGGSVHGIVQEFHHPIPRAAGGADGPTVSLCSGHHAIAHAVASRVLANKPFNDLLSASQSSLSAHIDSGIMRLADLLVRSTQHLSSDPNRRVNISFGLSNSDNDRLKSVAKSHKMSVANYLQSIVLRELNRELPVRRSSTLLNSRGTFK